MHVPNLDRAYETYDFALSNDDSSLGGFGSFAGLPLGQAQTPGPHQESEHVIPALDGPTLYVTYCAVCHGLDADGHGPMASVLKRACPIYADFEAQWRRVSVCARRGPH